MNGLVKINQGNSLNNINNLKNSRKNKRSYNQTNFKNSRRNNSLNQRGGNVLDIVNSVSKYITPALDTYKTVNTVSSFLGFDNPV